MIQIKKIYDKIDERDGFRILVDRLWPRGLSRNMVKVDLWLKEIAPSNELRKWFAHDPEKWAEFLRRYYEELKDKKEEVLVISEKAQGGTVTLLYGAKDEKHNNAVALKDFIERQNWLPVTSCVVVFTSSALLDG